MLEWYWRLLDELSGDARLGLSDLYRVAAQNDITVDFYRMEKCEALALMDEEGDAHIAIDPRKLKGKPDEIAKLGVMLGHCLTGAFYGPKAPPALRKRQRQRAEAWAEVFLRKGEVTR